MDDLIWLDPTKCPRCGLMVTDRWAHSVWHKEVLMLQGGDA